MSKGLRSSQAIVMLTGVWCRITDCAADAMMQEFKRQIAKKDWL